MDDKSLVKLGKNIFEAYLETNPIGSVIVKTFNDRNNELLIERMNYLTKEVEKLKNFEEKIKYLTDDNNKYIHLRNFLSFYFTRTDPALIETNIKIFLDYVNEKNSIDIYDKLLDKICLLNKESLNVLRKIKDNLKEDNYYEWEEFIKLYPSIDNKLCYRDILTSKEMSNDMLEVSFGIKTLIENDFIISLSTNYPGSIDVSNVDMFSLTGIGFIILDYI